MNSKASYTFFLMPVVTLWMAANIRVKSSSTSVVSGGTSTWYLMRAHKKKNSMDWCEDYDHWWRASSWGYSATNLLMRHLRKLWTVIFPIKNKLKLFFCFLLIYLYSFHIHFLYPACIKINIHLYVNT